MVCNSPSSCRLCSIISNPFLIGELRPCDTPFYSSPSFVSVPALGPLCEGHAMIVSRQHFASLLNMDCTYRKEFEDICLTFSSVWPTYNLTFAEHGSSLADGTGPCIAHTHVNIIPDVPENMLALDRHGHKLIATGSLDTLPEMTDAYFLIGRNGTWFLYDTGSAPSQHIRQLLYSWYDLPHWDWRLLPNEELAAATLKKWNSLHNA